jgi:hypothetical protein
MPLGMNRLVYSAGSPEFADVEVGHSLLWRARTSHKAALKKMLPVTCSLFLVNGKLANNSFAKSKSHLDALDVWGCLRASASTLMRLFDP